MTTATPHPATGGQERQRIAVVLIGFAHAAAVEEQRVVEERTVAVGRVSSACRGNLAKELDVVGVDLHHFGDVRRIVAVVRQPCDAVSLTPICG
jgi:hypothetical protein